MTWFEDDRYQAGTVGIQLDINIFQAYLFLNFTYLLEALMKRFWLIPSA
jgi:hypothetical protein